MPDGDPIRVRFGLQLPNFGSASSPAAIRTARDLAVEEGLDGLWASDHIVLVEDATSRYPYSRSGRYIVAPSEPWYEALTVLAALALGSGHLELGTSVCVVPLREPVLLAKQLATIDQLSGGRLLLGVGVGWLAEEYAAVGVPFERRGARADAAIDVLRACWTGEPDAGDYGPYTITPGVRCVPTPVQGTVPVLVGGNTDAAIRRAAGRGDGWYGASSGRGPSPEEVASIRDRLAEACRRAGRDADEVPMSLRVVLSDDALAGADTVDRLAAFVAAGVTRFTVDVAWNDVGAPARIAALGRLAADVRRRVEVGAEAVP